MPRSRLTSQLAFPAAILLSAAAALVPMGWPVDGWTSDLASIVRFPLKPFAHAGVALESWLRPAPSAAEGVPAEARTLVEQLMEERDRYQQLFRRQERRVQELEEQLRQLQQIPADTLRHASSSIIAHVTARNPESTLGVVEVTPQRGAQRDVAPNTIAVYAGVHLLGKIVDEPARAGCKLLPVTNVANSYITARVFPRAHRDLPPQRGELTQLIPTGSGTFTAQVDRSVDIGEGDLVRLDDPSWPPTAQMMVLGEVVSIQVNDMEPLRNTILVKPAYQVHQVAYVTLIVPEGADVLAGEEAAP